jgi:hypothetical protein
MPNGLTPSSDRNWAEPGNVLIHFSLASFVAIVNNCLEDRRDQTGQPLLHSD